MVKLSVHDASLGTKKMPLVFSPIFSTILQSLLRMDRVHLATDTLELRDTHSADNIAHSQCG